MKFQCMAGALCAVLVAGCTDPQQPASISTATPAPGAEATSTPQPLASAADTAIAQVPDWVNTARASDRVDCYVDVLDGAERTSQGWRLSGRAARLSGWSVDRDQQNQPGALLVLEGAQIFAFKAARSQRDDVTQNEAFRELAPVLPGVLASMWLEGVPAGSYRMSMLLGEGESALRCDLGEANQLIVP